jgi:hypothetical protein
VIVVIIINYYRDSVLLIPEKSDTANYLNSETVRFLLRYSRTWVTVTKRYAAGTFRGIEGGG